MSNRIDVAIQDASDAVSRVTYRHTHALGVDEHRECPACYAHAALEPKPQPEWSAEDRRLAAARLEEAVREFRRHLR